MEYFSASEEKVTPALALLRDEEAEEAEEAKGEERRVY